MGHGPRPLRIPALNVVDRQITRPVDDEFLGPRIEIALTERRRIDRVKRAVSALRRGPQQRDTAEGDRPQRPTIAGIRLGNVRDEGRLEGLANVVARIR